MPGPKMNRSRRSTEKGWGIVLDVLQERDLYRLDLAELISKYIGSAPWTRQWRQQAFERFQRLGLPSTKDESWRFTNIKALARESFGRPVGGPELSPAEVAPYLLTGSRYNMVFLDGAFQPQLSRLADLPEGVSLTPISEALIADGALPNHLAKIEQKDGFAALNGAFLENGMVLRVAPGVVLSEPIELVYLVRPTQGQAPVVHPYNLIQVGENAEASVVESYFGLGEGVYWTNAVTQVEVAANGRLRYYYEQHESESAYHIHRLHVAQERGSSFRAHHLLIGGGLVRNEAEVVFRGEGAETFINGLYVGHGRQHLDNHLFIDHAVPHCSSTQFFKGIMDDQSHGVFCGRIVVREDAQKTDSKQTNRNLLLSTEAMIDTQPQLEIYADDVKCAHGATTGQLDEDALFYLRTRGLDPESARDLLVYAFAHEVLDRMGLDALKQRAEAFLLQRFETARLLGSPL